MTLHHGDCIEVMAGMAAESVDAIVTDPPYDLLSASRNGSRRTPPTNAAGNPFARHDRGGAAGGFMGKAWDGTGIAFRPETWAAAYRVAKPGAYLLAFGGTRTVHRMTCALEDAGWIIRDMLVWGYASGFPKGRANLKPAWEPIVMARKPGPLRMLNIDECRIPGADGDGHWSGDDGFVESTAGRWPANVVLTDPIFDGGIEGVVGGGTASDAGAPTDVRGLGGIWHDGNGVPAGPQYGDSGTYSRFFMIPQPGRSDALSGTMGACRTCNAPIAGQPSTARTPEPDTAPPSVDTSPNDPRGQLAFDAASPSPSPETATAPRRARTKRGGTPDSTATGADQATANDTSGIGTSTSPEPTPAIASPSDQPARTAELQPTSTGTTTTTADPSLCGRCADDAIAGRTLPPLRPTRPALTVDGDDYTRFLIIPKAARSDREPVLGGLAVERVVSVWGGDEDDLTPGKKSTVARRNVHPTVKPTDLMRHLVRLVTPAGGTVLDPFLGSGTTALAAELEGFGWIGIEKEAEYVAIAEARLNGTQKGMGL